MSEEQEYQLILAAQEGIQNSFTPRNLKTDLRIGAAVLTDRGRIYSSGYYHSDTGSLTLHAEQAALSHAASHGEYGIVAIAIAWNEAAQVKNHGQKIYPCHVCKQLLWESHLRSHIDTEILVVEKGEISERLMLKDILSFTWPK